MLVYWKGFSGVNLLLKILGSAMYRASFPGMVSVLIYLLMVHYKLFAPKELQHAYASGVLIESVVLILVFRSNHSYQRYWEACGNVHLMMSKWLDATAHTAAFHMQCRHYDGIRPLSTMEMIKISKQENGFKRGILKRQPTFRRLNSPDCSINPIERKRTIVEMDGFELMDDYENTLLTNLPGMIKSGRLDGGWGLLDEGNDKCSIGSWVCFNLRYNTITNVLF